MKKTIRLKIQSYDDRRDLAAILADNGYKVKIEIREDNLFKETYFVIIEL